VLAKLALSVLALSSMTPWGCAMSHERPIGIDGAISADATVLDADAGSIDSGTQDMGEPAIPFLSGGFTRLAGARDYRVFDGETANTWLVGGSNDPDTQAILIEPSFDGGEVDFSRTFSIDDTFGYAPVAAARDGNRLLIAFEREDAEAVVVYVDGNSGARLSSVALSGVLGRPQKIDLALRGPHATAVVERFEPQSLDIRTWNVDESAPFAQLAAYTLPELFSCALTPDADGAGSVIAANTVTHDLQTFHVTDSELIALDLVDAEAVLPAWDGATLAYLHESTWTVGAQMFALEPMLTQINGEPSVARAGDDEFVLAFGADSGRIVTALTLQRGGGIAWYEVPATSGMVGFMGYPVAHLDDTHHGVFFLEVFLGSGTPRIRYFDAESAAPAL
jgi:hypothetical protein